MEFHTRLRELCKKYADEAYTVTTTQEKAFRVATQMKILKELVEQSADMTYVIEPRFIDIGQASRTIGVTVKLKSTLSESILLEAFGICSRYTYTLESKVKDATTEVAQTIALGKALSLLGINASEASSTYTKDEMTIFEKTNQKIDPVALKTKAAALVSELDEDLKKRMRIANMGLDAVLDLVDVNETTVEQLTKRVLAFLEIPKSAPQTNVK